MKHVTPPPTAEAVFGHRLQAAQRYADFLVTVGVDRGMIGPRETDRVWDRHILNSAALGELILPGERIADIGSGAGLPGIPLALARPDVQVTLIESMQRRCEFLTEVVDVLGLAVTVVRGRAEDSGVQREVGEMDVVTSRAVGSLDKLATWGMGMLRDGGRMLALKGARAEAEVEESRRVLARVGVVDVRVLRCGADYLDPAAIVVEARRAMPVKGPGRPRRSGRR
ncbi:16S rRNA (guanine(527)-N(7))-methyltransferase RsmG [Mycolicibacterium doricum]|uniref:Ribosomal RNA small subunit methyltransferase G n=1 Tax=Mycolicibacterium doricum TaxID=126673 RepID=A0A1X1SZ80_9MYCO|nr:16S rRNA (guanine(527)-N(7))-methyltransferase RsmG [Mycolicibacterium doricum]MCV7269072.1 16S rRNA (guanine(527)-N(7))-methyltransferase RsmG [Mycolicibacterium doricum]ORV37035.1 16S rRNA (guanine(527)-N(7))-methyltransferase RsmG [Mycolicibacterium doricum]